MYLGLNGNMKGSQKPEVAKYATQQPREAVPRNNHAVLTEISLNNEQRAIVKECTA